MSIPELDLHQRTHEEADSVVEEFLAFYETPLRIITGNSSKMKSIVHKHCKSLGLVANEESPYRQGALIVVDA